MTYLQKAKDLYAMVGQGQIMEAFEKFYHSEVVMQEIGEEPRVGKEVNREYEKNFVSSIKEIHGGGVDAFTSDEENGITMVQNWMELTFQNGAKVKLDQVAIQHWKGDHIIKEVFYHK